MAPGGRGGATGRHAGKSNGPEAGFLQATVDVGWLSKDRPSNSAANTVARQGRNPYRRNPHAAAGRENPVATRPAGEVVAPQTNRPSPHNPQNTARLPPPLQMPRPPGDVVVRSSAAGVCRPVGGDQGSRVNRTDERLEQGPIVQAAVVGRESSGNSRMQHPLATNPATR